MASDFFLEHWSVGYIEKFSWIQFSCIRKRKSTHMGWRDSTAAMALAFSRGQLAFDAWYPIWSPKLASVIP